MSAGRLNGKLAPEILIAPNTMFDPAQAHRCADVSVIINALDRLSCTPWLDSLALAGAICAVRGFALKDIVRAMRTIDQAFGSSPPDLDDWHVDAAIATYLARRHKTTSWRKVSHVLGSTMMISYEMRSWYSGLGYTFQRTYVSIVQPFILGGFA